MQDIDSRRNLACSARSRKLPEEPFQCHAHHQLGQIRSPTNSCKIPKSIIYHDSRQNKTHKFNLRSPRPQGAYGIQ
jgi:hypothetical protein